MIVIKVNEVPKTKDALKERVRRAWRINPSRLYGQDDLIAVFKGEVIEEYKVLDYRQDDVDSKRVQFTLKEKANSLYKGQRINYRTANPCTTVDPVDIGLIPTSPVLNHQQLKQYSVIKPEVREVQLREALEKGLNRSLDTREERYVKWHANNDYETSGILLDWILELSKKN